LVKRKFKDENPKMKIQQHNFALAVIVIVSLSIFPVECDVKFHNFTYTEQSTQDNLTGNPNVWFIGYYKDNTAVIRIARINYYNGVTRCLEQRLLLRVIQPNGDVIKIDLNDKGIQDFNYCISRYINPIRVYTHYFNTFW
ncbi:24321_t:CDS:1, partial [Racocetra persica]